MLKTPPSILLVGQLPQIQSGRQTILEVCYWTCKISEPWHVVSKWVQERPRLGELIGFFITSKRFKLSTTNKLVVRTWSLQLHKYLTVITSMIDLNCSFLCMHVPHTQHIGIFCCLFQYYMLWCSSFPTGTEFGAHITGELQKWSTVSRVNHWVCWEQSGCYLPCKFTLDTRWVSQTVKEQLINFHFSSNKQTTSLVLISMKKRCSSNKVETDTNDTNKAAVMEEMKHNLPIEMRVNSLYGLSQSVTNLSQRENDVFGSELHRQRSQISVYEDVP